jgi:hypothetical protein
MMEHNPITKGGLYMEEKFNNGGGSYRSGGLCSEMIMPRGD